MTYFYNSSSQIFSTLFYTMPVQQAKVAVRSFAKKIIAVITVNADGITRLRLANKVIIV